MPSSDRPSHPDPLSTPVAGFTRPGILYVDDSETALQTLRRALYAHGLILETYSSAAALWTRSDGPVVAALLDVDLGDNGSGLDVARDLRARHPHVALAFLTGAPSEAREAELRPYGPVLRKDGDVPRAIAWLVAAAQTAQATQQLG